MTNGECPVGSKNSAFIEALTWRVKTLEDQYNKLMFLAITTLIGVVANLIALVIYFFTNGVL